MTEANPALEYYITTFEAALKRYDCAESGEIVRDLSGHIAEAIAMGRPVDEVLAAMGPAEALARAYAVELALNPRGAGLQRNIGGALRIAGILAGATFVTLLVVMTLGSIGLAFTTSGVALIVIGALEAAGIHYEHVQLAGLSPWIVIALGPLFGVIGAAALWGLWGYLKAFAHMLVRSLPVKR